MFFVLLILVFLMVASMKENSVVISSVVRTGKALVTFKKEAKRLMEEFVFVNPLPIVYSWLVDVFMCVLNVFTELVPVEEHQEMMHVFDTAIGSPVLQEDVVWYAYEANKEEDSKQEAPQPREEMSWKEFKANNQKVNDYFIRPRDRARE